LKSIAYLKAAAKARHIFWVSQSAFEGYAFHKLFLKKSSVLYNIINIRRLLEKAESDINHYDYDVVFLGSLIYPKNPHKLIDVCCDLVAKKNDVRIAVIGTGDLEQEIIGLVAQKGLSDNIVFLGFQNNPYKIIKDAKCMIMTSRWEGTPMCALEGMALGVPMVATPVDGLKRLIVDGENGFLSDDDAVLAQRIFEIITIDGLHRSMSNDQLNKSNKMNNSNYYREEIEKVYANQ
jgi:glycosyltransferase involved in cell wall biosynthesis